jgi:uncharacterized protein involved in response to NO
MTTTAERYRTYRGPALFSMGFRPFFLFASAWAALAVPIWIAAYAGLLSAEQFTRNWHVHEMLFGYLGGVIAGFLLTAVPNWTGRLPVAGASLAALFALWAAGRFAMLFTNELGALAAVVDSSFLFALAAVIAREILAGKNTRNIPVSALVTLLGVANLLWHFGGAEAALVAERIGLGVVAMLVTLIGGRIVPSFTRNWMAKQQLKPEPAPTNQFDFVTLAITALAVLAWIAAPLSALAGVALTLAGLLNFIRLLRWRGWKTWPEPLVLVLHAGYFWLALGFTLIGLSVLAPAVFPSPAGIHALTAGAFGVMTLAVMTRASLGHTGQPLTASPHITLIYALVNLAAAVRTASPFFPEQYALLLTLAAILWSGAFAAFVIVYAPLLLRPRAKA